MVKHLGTSPTGDLGCRCWAKREGGGSAQIPEWYDELNVVMVYEAIIPIRLMSVQLWIGNKVGTSTDVASPVNTPFESLAEQLHIPLWSV